MTCCVAFDYTMNSPSRLFWLLWFWVVGVSKWKDIFIDREEHEETRKRECKSGLFFI